MGKQKLLKIRRYRRVEIQLLITTNQRIKNEVVKSEDYDWLTNSKDEQYGAGFKVKQR